MIATEPKQRCYPFVSVLLSAYFIRLNYEIKLHDFVCFTGRFKRLRDK